MNKCENKCLSMTMTCPNVAPYPSGAKRHAHSEVACKICNTRWLWGLSWDGDMDGQFTCPTCIPKTNQELVEEKIDAELSEEVLRNDSEKEYQG